LEFKPSNYGLRIFMETSHGKMAEFFFFFQGVKKRSRFAKL